MTDPAGPGRTGKTRLAPDAATAVPGNPADRVRQKMLRQAPMEMDQHWMCRILLHAEGPNAPELQAVLPPAPLTSN